MTDKGWRPEGWEYQQATVVDIDKFPKKTWDVAHSCGWRDGYEAGADALLKVLRKLEDSKQIDSLKEALRKANREPLEVILVDRREK